MLSRGACKFTSLDISLAKIVEDLRLFTELDRVLDDLFDDLLINLGGALGPFDRRDRSVACHWALRHRDLLKEFGKPAALVAIHWAKSGVTFHGYRTSGKNDKSGDPAVDALLEKARIERNTEARRKLVQDAQRLLGKAQHSMIMPQGAVAASSSRGRP